MLSCPPTLMTLRSGPLSALLMVVWLLYSADCDLILCCITTKSLYEFTDSWKYLCQQGFHHPGSTPPSTPFLLTFLSVWM